LDTPLQTPATAGGDPAFWFINSLVIFKATADDTEGKFSLFQQVAPSGFATPYHTHQAYGEGFYVLQGEVTFFSDGNKSVLSAGGFLYIPGSLPHGFRVTSATPATMLIVSPPPSTFAAFVQEMGEPATSLQLPIPSQPDFAKLGMLSAKHGSQTLGPLPG
jgi:quercetin dioxygenase-like cupin family protein